MKDTDFARIFELENGAQVLLFKSSNDELECEELVLMTRIDDITAKITITPKDTETSEEKANKLFREYTSERAQKLYDDLKKSKEEAEAEEMEEEK